MHRTIRDCFCCAWFKKAWISSSIKLRLVMSVSENSALNSLSYAMPSLSAFVLSRGGKHGTRLTQPVEQFHPYDWLCWVHQSTFSCKASSSNAETQRLRNASYSVVIILEVKSYVSGNAQKFTTFIMKRRKDVIRKQFFSLAQLIILHFFDSSFRSWIAWDNAK